MTDVTASFLESLDSDDTKQHGTCSSCGNPKDEHGFCRLCRAARSRRWYQDNVKRESAKRAVAQKLKRRLGAQVLDEIRVRMVAEQDGRCACCGDERDLNIDWSLDDVADDGLPLTRGAICRSCKIAVNRVVFPSKFVLTDEQLTMVEKYLGRAWVDARQSRTEQGGDRSSTEELADWLDSLD